MPVCPITINSYSNAKLSGSLRLPIRTLQMIVALSSYTSSTVTLLIGTVGSERTYHSCGRHRNYRNRLSVSRRGTSGRSKNLLQLSMCTGHDHDKIASSKSCRKSSAQSRRAVPSNDSLKQGYINAKQQVDPNKNVLRYSAPPSNNKTRVWQ